MLGFTVLEAESGTYHTGYGMIIIMILYCSTTAGPGSDDPEHDESTPAETKIVTFVLPSRIILRL